MTTNIMSARQSGRTLRRLASEVVERNRGTDNLLFFGIETAGVRLAHVLAAATREIGNVDIPCFGLDVRAFRDDRTSSESEAKVSSEAVVADATDRDIVLVDDVLFTGRTARAALDALMRYGRPRSIQFLVLIDRGHREYPIQPDYVGRVLPTKHKERVIVTIGDGVTVDIVE